MSKDKFFTKTNQKHVKTVESKPKPIEPDASDGDKSKPSQKPPKKPFNKREWRERKYSKKFKLQQWEEKRKKQLLKEFFKQTGEKVQTPNTRPNRVHYVVHPDKLNTSNSDGNTQKPNKFSPYRAAEREYERIQQERKNRKEEIAKQRAERQAKMLEYKLKKREKNKILFKKNRRGQPVMQGRLEMLYEKIKASVGS